MILGTLGLCVGLFGLWGLSLINPNSLDDQWPEIIDSLKDSEWLSEEDLDSASNLDKATVSEMLQSPRLRLFGYLMLVLGLIFNAALFYFGYTFAKGRLGCVWAFIALLLCEAVYMYGVPYLLVLLMSEGATALSLEIGGAWGIGNMGLSLILLTHFWFWGPVVALVVGKLLKPERGTA